ncbi:Pectin lyase fold/virulence factor [Mycena venus]|uniref:Pectin lyase fold/virulence factor n=1 Tax=Mycena venus TaxID=2733690 RepID=A0A8H6X8I9_9AGAR|nr:Pectin lyase fold/virulence factor [Mycena venus]
MTAKMGARVGEAGEERARGFEEDDGASRCSGHGTRRWGSWRAGCSSLGYLERMRSCLAFDVKAISAEALTHVNFAFALISGCALSSFQVVGMASGDSDLLIGDWTFNDPPTQKNFHHGCVGREHQTTKWWPRPWPTCLCSPICRIRPASSWLRILQTLYKPLHNGSRGMSTMSYKRSANRPLGSRAPALINAFGAYLSKSRPQYQNFKDIQFQNIMAAGFGAAGDGIKDDTVAIQNFIQANTGCAIRFFEADVLCHHGQRPKVRKSTRSDPSSASGESPGCWRSRSQRHGY